MKIVLAALLALVSGQNVRHSVVGPRPRPIEFHGIQGVDVESDKPEAAEAGFAQMRAKADAIIFAEEDHIAKQMAAARKVERDFLNSDLHKEAVGNKLVHVLD